MRSTRLIAVGAMLRDKCGRAQGKRLQLPEPPPGAGVFKSDQMMMHALGA